MADAPQTIAADKLCVLTGLTDRRHRQLADEGYFPHPKESQYVLVPTIQGMFRYYRELKDKAKGRLTELKELKTEREAERLRLENLRLEGKMVEIAAVNERDLHLSSLQKTILYQRLGSELGARGEGKNAAELNVLGLTVADEICDLFTQGVDEWQKTIAI